MTNFFQTLEEALRTGGKLPQVHSDTRMFASPEFKVDELSNERQSEFLFLDDRFESTFGCALTPPKDHIRIFNEIQRIPRLAEGDYRLRSLPFEHTINEINVAVPESIVTLEHKRTHHHQAKFDASRFEKDNFIEIIEDLKSFGELSQVINVSAADRHFSTTLSAFTMLIAKPAGYDDLVSRYRALIDNEVGPSNLEFRKTVDELLKKGTQKSKVIREIEKYSRNLFQKNNSLIRDYSDLGAKILGVFYGSILKLTQEYASLLGGPNVTVFERSRFVAVDSESRVLSMYGGFEQARLNVLDLRTAPFYSVELLPFNDLFHEKLKTSLMTKMPSVNVDEFLPKVKIMTAYRLLQQGDYDAAIVTAATAFEVALNHFLIKNNAATREDLESTQYSLSQRIGTLFDQAVNQASLDSSNDRRWYRVFPSEIREQILSIKDQNRIGLQQIRNAQVHWGIGPDNKSTNHAEAYAVCTAYYQAIDFILQKRWETPSNIPSLNDVFLCNNYFADGNIPPVPDSRAQHAMQKSLEASLEYLQPVEIRRRYENSDDCSFVKKIFGNV